LVVIVIIVVVIIVVIVIVVLGKTYRGGEHAANRKHRRLA
jgi:preprotein translocase subunit SecG